jgi:peptidoglycan hydrolase-like protein with peptidoglycan-binding domain
VSVLNKFHSKMIAASIAVVLFIGATGALPATNQVLSPWISVTAYAAAAAVQPPTDGSVTIGSNCKSGGYVTWLQQSLKALSFDPGTIDGLWGTKTKTAVINYQLSRGLAHDGLAGKNTLTKLVSEVSPKSNFKYNSPNVVIYSKNTQGNVYVSKNFQVKEFACKDGSDTVKVDLALVERLQAIRDHFGKAVTIVSGYRTDAYNKTVPGAATGSYHVKGQAADISISGVSRAQIRAYAITIGLSYEIYTSDSPNATGLTQHLDTRNIANPISFRQP